MVTFKTLRVTSIIGYITLLCTACGQGEKPVQETPDAGEEDMTGTPDVFDADYWKKAELVWSDEFDGNQVDGEKWTFESGDHGWGNNELQNYVEEGSTEVSGGTLKIIARQEEQNGVAGSYVSARMNSKTAFTYGKLEIRAKVPEHKGDGLWPALWMLGSEINAVGWPACGEIDIMEYVSFEPDQMHFSLHSTANNHAIGTQITSGPVGLETIEEEFHVYGVLWTASYIKFYIDNEDNVKLNFIRPATSNGDNWPFSKPFYFLMNIAVGGNWGGIEGVDNTIFPAIMEVDYVRVYQVP